MIGLAARSIVYSITKSVNAMFVTACFRFSYAESDLAPNRFYKFLIRLRFKF